MYQKEGSSSNSSQTGEKPIFYEIFHKNLLNVGAINPTPGFYELLKLESLKPLWKVATKTSSSPLNKGSIQHSPARPS